MNESRSLVVPEGSRATVTGLVREMLEISHSRAKTLVAAGLCRVNGAAVVDPALRPDPGSKVAVMESTGGVPAAPKRTLSGPGFRVVHLDKHLIVVDKAQMVLTIPVPEDDPNDPSLVARVSAALAVAGHKEIRLWVVHRIDRETSGLVLFARSPRAWERLREQFRARTPLREYIAWTEGVPSPPKGRLNHRLHEDEKSKRVMAVNPRQPGKDAELSYAVEELREGKTPRARVRVRLTTGRRNQIRVQFSAKGWPLLGDRFYGARDRGCGRTALHAARLGFNHPVTNAPLVFESPLPVDLKALDRELFAKVQGPGSQKGAKPNPARPPRAKDLRKQEQRSHSRRDERLRTKPVDQEAENLESPRTEPDDKSSRRTSPPKTSTSKSSVRPSSPAKPIKRKAAAREQMPAARPVSAARKTAATKRFKPRTKR